MFLTQIFFWFGFSEYPRGRTLRTVVRDGVDIPADYAWLCVGLLYVILLNGTDSEPICLQSSGPDASSDPEKDAVGEGLDFCGFVNRHLNSCSDFDQRLIHINVGRNVLGCRVFIGIILCSESNDPPHALFIIYYAQDGQWTGGHLIVARLCPVSLCSQHWITYRRC